MRTVLVTGATGFVGRNLCTRFRTEGWRVIGTLLADELPSSLANGVTPAIIAPIGPDTVWDDALRDVDTIVHLAARVHVMKETATDPLWAFRQVNTAGTGNLARQAAATGVRRFVFISTIGVHGASSGTAQFRESDTPTPHNPYAVSKWEAEKLLEQIASATGMDVVIVRAPLVYGPGNPGNFLSLLRIVSREVPLPFAGIVNKRSLVYVGNLVDALAICTVHPAAVGKTYLISDGEDVSTPELIRKIAHAMGRPARLFQLFPALLSLVARLSGKSASARQLLDSLVVDSSLIRRELDWLPPFTMDEGLQATADWFVNN